MAPRVFLRMLCLSGAVLLASAQQSIAHFGGGGYSDPREPALSKYNTATKQYEPVTSDRQYIYYRLKVNLDQTFYDFYAPDPNKTSLISNVISGKVFDNSTGVQVGTYDSFSITTSVTAEKVLSFLSTMAVELGPNGDDAIFVQAALDRANLGEEPTDYDLAITGGTGRYKGATGEVQHTGERVSLGDNVYVADVAVPRFKRF